MIKRILFIAIILAMPCTVYAGDVTNLEGAWLLNETSGTRYDQSVNSNDLTDNNTALYGTGQFGNAADFERDNSEYLSITDATQTGLDITGDWTFVTWFKAESTGISQGLFEKGSDYRILLTDAQQISAYSGGSALNTAASTFSAGVWIHIATVYNATTNTLEIFVNGSSSASGSANDPTDNSSPFYIGRWSSGFYLDGLVDETMVFSRQLDSTEINDIKDNGIEAFMASAGRTQRAIVIS